jgi:hypothetical protein
MLSKSTIILHAEPIWCFQALAHVDILGVVMPSFLVLPFNFLLALINSCLISEWLMAWPSVSHASEL